MKAQQAREHNRLAEDIEGRCQMWTEGHLKTRDEAVNLLAGIVNDCAVIVHQRAGGQTTKHDGQGDCFVSEVPNGRLPHSELQMARIWRDVAVRAIGCLRFLCDTGSQHDQPSQPFSTPMEFYEIPFYARLAVMVALRAKFNAEARHLDLGVMKVEEVDKGEREYWAADWLQISGRLRTLVSEAKRLSEGLNSSGCELPESPEPVPGILSEVLDGLT